MYLTFTRSGYEEVIQGTAKLIQEVRDGFKSLADAQRIVRAKHANLASRKGAWAMAARGHCVWAEVRALGEASHGFEESRAGRSTRDDFVHVPVGRGVR